jgi:RNA recognition motif-containing protein
MGNKLYVGNLSYDTDEATLRSTFASNDRNVEEVVIIVDRDTGRPRGFAFVTMASSKEALSAIQELNGTELDGRNITVSEAREKSEGGGGGGGGRGGRGGYGGGGGGGGGRSGGGGGGGQRRW